MFKKAKLIQDKETFTAFLFNGEAALYPLTNNVLVEFPKRDRTTLLATAQYGVNREVIVFKASLTDEMTSNLKKIKGKSSNKERFLDLITENLQKLKNPSDIVEATDGFLGLCFEDNDKIELDLVLKAIFDALSEE